MGDGNFELNTPGWYTVEQCELNEWLNNKLESDQYGLYYTVKFEGDAGTYLWQAKTAPEVGKKYWGHIEMAKSGKSTRFKKDKEPEGQPRPAGANSWTESPEKQASINRAVALNNAVNYVNTGNQLTPDEVVKVADHFYSWLNNELSEEPEYTTEDIPDFGDDDATV